MPRVSFEEHCFSRKGNAVPPLPIYPSETLSLCSLRVHSVSTTALSLLDSPYRVYWLTTIVAKRPTPPFPALVLSVILASILSSSHSLVPVFPHMNVPLLMKRRVRFSAGLFRLRDHRYEFDDLPYCLMICFLRFKVSIAIEACLFFFFLFTAILYCTLGWLSRAFLEVDSVLLKMLFLLCRYIRGMLIRTPPDRTVHFRMTQSGRGELNLWRLLFSQGRKERCKWEFKRRF